MKITFTTIGTDASVVAREMDEDELAEAIDGLDRLPLFTRYQGKPCVAFCSPALDPLELGVNKAACRLWWDATGDDVQATDCDTVAGDVFIVQGDDDERLKAILANH